MGIVREYSPSTKLGSISIKMLDARERTINLPRNSQYPLLNVTNARKRASDANNSIGKRSRCEEIPIDDEEIHQSTAVCKENCTNINPINEAVRNVENPVHHDPLSFNIIRKIMKLQKKFSRAIDKIASKSNSVEEFNRSHNRTQQQQLMLNGTAAKLIDFKTNQSQFPTEKALRILLNIHEDLHLTLASYYKYFHYLDLFPEYLINLYGHIECATKLFCNYCREETHSAHILLNKLQNSIIDMKNAAKPSTQKNRLATGMAQGKRDKLSMYASDQNRRSVYSEAQRDSLRAKGMRKIKRVIVKNGDGKLNRSNVPDRKITNPAIVDPKWYVSVPANVDSQFTDQHLKFLHEHFITKKEVWSLIQAAKGAIVSCNAKHSAEIPVYEGSKTKITPPRKQNSGKPNERDCQEIRKNIRNVEKSFQFAKNVKLIEIIADDGTTTPRCSYPNMISGLNIDQRRLHLEAKAKNPLYANEQFVEPWKVVTSIADSIFFDQMMHVWHGTL